MKTVKKNVYYCDYCKKRSLAAWQMRNHESGCTANPDRECLLCGEDRNIKAFIEKLKERFDIKDCEPEDGYTETRKVIWKGEDITLGEILEFTDNCPNCTLAILRQTKLNYKVFGFHYDYKRELSELWKERNDDKRDLQESYYPY